MSRTQGLNLVLTEADFDPYIEGVNQLIFPDGTLTDNGDGSVSITFDSIVASGTSEGQTLYWNATAGQWQPHDHIIIDGTNGVNNIDFDTTGSSTNQAGRMRWNDTDRCLEYDSYINGDTITNQIGQETWIRVRNDTDSEIANGAPVYISGAIGNRPTIALANASAVLTSRTYVGITTQAIGINEDGFVTIVGSVRKLDTTGASYSQVWNEGDLIYVSETTAGHLTNVRPTAPNFALFVGIVTVKNVSNGEIGVRALTQPLLDQLSNVYISSVADGDLISYNTSNSRWENKLLSEVTTGFTEGSVIFQGASGLTEDNSNLFWNDSSNILGIGTTDLDGTPATGRLVVKGSTNDGTTNILVGRDSDEVNVVTIDTDGNITSNGLALTNSPTIGGVALNSTTAGSAGCSLVGIEGIGTPTWTEQCDFNKLFGSTGRATGGTITDNADNTATVAAGTGFIKATDSDTAELLAFDWSETSGISTPSDTVKYIGVEYNAGSPQIISKDTYSWDFDTDFPLGVVVTETINSVDYVTVIDNPWWVTDGITNVTQALRSFGLIRRDETVGGLALSVTGTRNVAVSAGSVWTGLNDFAFSGLDTSVSGSFDLYWYSSTNGWQESDSTQYSITQWNDITQAALQTIDNNKFCSIWVYGEIKNGVPDVALIYPQAQYNTSAEAEAEAPPTTLPIHIRDFGLLVGKIIIKQGVTAPVEVLSAFETIFNPALATDHANLSNLAWTSSNHTGTASTFAVFDGTGAAAEYSIPLSISYGGTGQTTQQAAIDALTNVSAATNEYVLTKDTGTGNAIWKAAAGGGGGGLVYISSQTASNSSSLDFTSDIDSTYDAYVFEVVDLIPATDTVQLYMRVSEDSGSTWKSGASDYNYNFVVSGTLNSSTGAAQMILSGSSTNGIGNGTGESYSSSIKLYKPSSTSIYKKINVNASWSRPDGRTNIGNGACGYIGTTNAINGIRFIMSSGNITSGIIRLYGIVNS